MTHLPPRLTWLSSPPPAGLAQRQRTMRALSGLYVIEAVVLLVVSPLLFAPAYPRLAGGVAMPLRAAVLAGAVLLWLLLRRAGPACQPLAWPLTAATGWLLTITVVILCASYTASSAPVALLVALAALAIGIDGVGLLRGAVVTEGALVSLVGAQRYILQVIDDASARVAIFTWTVLLLLIALLSRIVVHHRSDHEPPAGAPAPATPTPALADEAPAARRPPLSLRERAILPYLLTPHSYDEIALVFGISGQTIKKHKQNIAVKLQAPNEKRLTLLDLALARQLVTAEDIHAAATRTEQVLAVRSALATPPAPALQPIAGLTTASTSRPRSARPTASAAAHLRAVPPQARMPAEPVIEPDQPAG